MTSKLRICALLAVLIVSIAGCLRVTDPGVTTVDYLDPKTVNTVTHLSVPVVFAREEPSLAVNVRDYLYAGPFEVNRVGEISYYLWLGEWSTIDRLPADGDGVAAISASAQAYSVVVWLDGQPTALPNDRPPTLGRMPYSGPVESLRPLFLRVSRDQLRRMASAKNMAVELQDGNGSRRYRLWSGDPTTFGKISALRATLD